MGDDEGLMRPFDENHRGRPMTQQRAADRIAATVIGTNLVVDFGSRERAEREGYPAIELGLLLLSDDGPKALAEALRDAGAQWSWDDAARGGKLFARTLIVALTAKLRERA